MQVPAVEEPTGPVDIQMKLTLPDNSEVIKTPRATPGAASFGIRERFFTFNQPGTYVLSLKVSTVIPAQKSEPAAHASTPEPTGAPAAAAPPSDTQHGA